MSNVVRSNFNTMSDAVKESLSVLKSVFTLIIQSLTSFATKHPILATAISLICIGVGYKLANTKEIKEAYNEIQAESYPHGTPKMVPHARAVTVGKPTLTRRAQGEMGKSQGMVNAQCVIARQQYYLQCIKGEQVINMGTVTNITGRIYMMPYHFLMGIDHFEPEELVFTNVANPLVVIRKPYEGFFSDIVSYNSDEEHPKDLCLFEFAEIPRGKNIMHHFCNLEDVVKIQSRTFDARLCGGECVGVYPNHEIKNVSDGGPCSLLDMRMTYSVGIDNKNITANSLITYSIPTAKGDCGKLLIANNDQLRGRIVGMHINGTKSGSNQSQAISYEILMSGVMLFDAAAQCAADFPSLKNQDSTSPIESGFIHIGQLKDDIPQIQKTSLRKSKLYGKIQEPLTRPAILKPIVVNGQNWDPLEEGAKKAGKQCGYVQPAILEACKRDVINRLRENHVPNPPEIRVLSYEESVQGVEGDDLFQPIARSTSPGYPYNMHKPGKGKGKTPWIGMDDYDYTSDAAKQLRRDVEELIHKCKHDEFSEVLWVDVLKDERLPHAKVDIGKTRIISNGPMHYNIAFRKYFLGALAYIRHNKIYNGIGVGINVWSREWDLLANHLTAISPHLIDGDFAGYDGSISDQVMWAVFEVIDSLYEPNEEDTKIRRALWSYACYATRVNRGRVYQCTHSLPSGFPATAEANSIYELIIFRAAFIMLGMQTDPKLANLKAFNDNVRMITYGDDNLLSISPQVIDWFNMESLIKIMKSFRMDYTPADKTDNIVKYKTIGEVSFLKRSFKRVDTTGGKLPIYVCPADLHTRLDMLNWTKAKPGDSSPEEALTIEDVFQELSVHGKKVYDKYTDIISREAAKAGITGYVDHGLFYYHHTLLTGSRLECDLAGPRQNTASSEGTSSAISTTGGAI